MFTYPQTDTPTHTNKTMHLFSILGTYFGTSANYANGAEAATVQEEKKRTQMNIISWTRKIRP